jgi:hypothetical protein
MVIIFSTGKKKKEFNSTQNSDIKRTTIYSSAKSPEAI